MPFFQHIANRLAVPKEHPQGMLWAGFACLVLLSILGAVALEAWWLMGLPAGAVLAWIAVVDLRRIFYLLMAAIPISTEVELPGGFGTDLVSEPLMWLLTLCAIVWFLRHWRSVNLSILKHPISLVLFAHLSWIFVATITSQGFVVSFKYLLAKGWYVIVFYFWASRMLQDERDYKELIWWFFVPMFVAVFWVFTRHASIGFSFELVEYVMGPFFRNHVMYACSLAIFLPFVWFATFWYKKRSPQWWFLIAGIVLFVVAINFAYTRAAYVALIAAIGMYWVVRFKLTRIALLSVALLFGLFVWFLKTQDNWLLFAPDYERAVSHKRFESLLQATTRLEDISIMERVYRWVAATYMIKDRPVTGFGPGNFYFFYKNYTVSSFKTYVSSNPERSGIHNGFLMVAVEQGLPGLFFFLLLVVTAILQGERIFHQCRVRSERRMLAAALLCFMLINMLMLMNDFVETDKIGSLFFLSLAIMVNTDLKNHRDKPE